MVHIGNTPASNFASVTKDTFSGDGSTTAFTLSKAATTNGVAVFVENVRQEPTTAYAVSGTTLTFTAAPVSASGNNKLNNIQTLCKVCHSYKSHKNEDYKKGRL